MHDHFVQTGQARLQAPEDPARQHFAGGVLQPIDVVEVVMIELVIDRREGRLHVGEVHDPAQRRIRLARYVDLDTEGMPVQSRAFMAQRHVRESMGRFDVEDFEDMHGAILPLATGGFRGSPPAMAVHVPKSDGHTRAQSGQMECVSGED